MFEICSDLSKTGLKIYSFCQHSKKAKKWPIGQTILFLANSFKKGQMAATLLEMTMNKHLNFRVRENKIFIFIYRINNCILVKVFRKLFKLRIEWG